MGMQTSLPPQPSAADAFNATSSGPTGDVAAPRTLAPGALPTARALPASTPLRIKIPSTAVDAPLTPLELDTSGRLGVPPDDIRNLAGWYRDSPHPRNRRKRHHRQLRRHQQRPRRLLQPRRTAQGQHRRDRPQGRHHRRVHRRRRRGLRQGRLPLHPRLRTHRHPATTPDHLRRLHQSHRLPGERRPVRPPHRQPPHPTAPADSSGAQVSALHLGGVVQQRLLDGDQDARLHGAGAPLGSGRTTSPTGPRELAAVPRRAGRRRGDPKCTELRRRSW